MSGWPRAISFFRAVMALASVGSPGKAGPRVWRYIHLGSRKRPGSVLGRAHQEANVRLVLGITTTSPEWG